MRRFTCLLAVALFALGIGIITNLILSASSAPTDQNLDALCGFAKIENPLCDLSPGLREIQSVSLNELIRSPQLYNKQIVRLSGTFFIENDSLAGTYIYDREHLIAVCKWMRLPLYGSDSALLGKI
jgi:hypothetical protein